MQSLTKDILNPIQPYTMIILINVWSYIETSPVARLQYIIDITIVAMSINNDLCQT